MIVNKIMRVNRNEFNHLYNNYIKYLKEYKLFFLDGTNIAKEQDYFDAFSNEFDFPSYFGNNVSAFIDCLTDLERRNEQGFIIVIFNYNSFLKKYKEEKRIFEKALQSVCFYLQEECLTASGGLNRLKSFDVYLIKENIDTLFKIKQ